MAGAARAHWLMLGISALACAVLWNGEHVLVAGGLGWDGLTYGKIVMDPAMALHDKYYLHRALPSWIVYAGLRLFRRPLETAQIIGGFLALNSLLVLATTALWRPLADTLQLSVRARWLGFAGLFWNFALLKMPFYYPVFTDTSAFALGVLIVFASLTGRQWLLALAILACTFTWPLGSLLAAPLLLWPPGQAGPPPRDAPALLPSLAAFGAAGAFLGWFVWMYVVRGQTIRAAANTTPVVPGVVWIGIAAAVAYTIVSVRSVLAGVTLQYVGAALRRINVAGLGLLIAAMLPARIIVALWGEGQPILSLRYFIGSVIFFSSTRPLLFAIGNIAYFGPVLLLLFNRKIRVGFVGAVRELGPGWMLFLVGAIGLSLNSESRQSILQYAVIVPILVLAADRAGLQARAVWTTAAVALALSKVWVPINVHPAPLLAGTDPEMAWHYRRYFMNQGPWMANEGYIINALAVLAAGAIVWWAMRGRDADAAGLGPSEATPEITRSEARAG